ncbi:MAG: FMN-binding protein [Oscillospiraceae bacterium]
MKKLITMFAALILVVAPLSGCFNNKDNSDADNNNTNDTAKNEFKDGKYMAEGASDDGYGFTPFLEIEVKDGKISDVIFDYKDKDGALKSADSSTHAAGFEKEAGMKTKEVLESLSDQYSKSSDITTIKKITGATRTSDKFVKMVEALEVNIKSGNSEKLMVTLY